MAMVVEFDATLASRIFGKGPKPFVAWQPRPAASTDSAAAATVGTAPPERPGCARDPSTPPAQLLKAAERAPASVLRNPAWQLACVADPGFLRRASDAALAAIVRCRAAGPDVLRDVAHAIGGNKGAWALHWRATSIALAMRADAPVELLASLAETTDPKLATVANALEIFRHRAKLPCGATDGWEAAVAVGFEPEIRTRHTVGGAFLPEVIGSLVKWKAVPLDSPIVRGLTLITSSHARLRMVANHRGQSSAWVELAARAESYGRTADRSQVWRECICAWRGEDPHRESIHLFQGGGLGAGYKRVAESRTWDSLCEEWARGVIRSSDGELVRTRYRRETLKLDRAIELAAREHRLTMVHTLLLCSTKCPVALLERRSRAPESILRAAVASNPCTPREVRARLRRDVNWVVRGAAGA